MNRIEVKHMIMAKPLAKGELRITDEVAALITEAAVNDTPGVAGTASGIRDELARVTGKIPARGIAIDSAENEETINVKISLEYGTNIDEVCRELQGKVKHEVEMMTGIKVSAVNVYVDQLVLPDE